MTTIKTTSKKAATKQSTKQAKPAVVKPAPAPAVAELPKLANNASQNAQYSHIMQLAPLAGVKAAPASAPFHRLTVADIKAGKITNLTTRCDCYHALYTALADNAGNIPLAGDKSVLATLLSNKIIAVNPDGASLKLLVRSPKKVGDIIGFNNGYTASIIKNPNFAIAA